MEIPHLWNHDYSLHGWNNLVLLLLPLFHHHFLLLKIWFYHQIHHCIVHHWPLFFQDRINFEFFGLTWLHGSYFERRPILKSKAAVVKWVKEWVPQDLVTTGGKCMILKWVTEDTLKTLKEKVKEPSVPEPGCSTWWSAQTSKMAVMDLSFGDPLYQKSSWQWVQAACPADGAAMQVPQVARAWRL